MKKASLFLYSQFSLQFLTLSYSYLYYHISDHVLTDLCGGQHATSTR